MRQENLSKLTLMSTELDLTDIIEEFALAKASKTAIVNRPIKLWSRIISESECSNSLQTRVYKVDLFLPFVYKRK